MIPLLCSWYKANGIVGIPGPSFKMNVSETKLDLTAFITFLEHKLEDQIDFDALDLRDNGIQGPDFLCLLHAICSSKIVIRHSLNLGDSLLGPIEAFFYWCNAQQLYAQIYNSQIYPDVN